MATHDGPAGCVFCDIAAGRGPASVVHSDEEVFHVHLHVIPRTAGDGFRIRAKWQRPARAELDSAAAQVRDGLAPG